MTQSFSSISQNFLKTKRKTTLHVRIDTFSCKVISKLDKSAFGGVFKYDILVTQTSSVMLRPLIYLCFLYWDKTSVVSGYSGIFFLLSYILLTPHSPKQSKHPLLKTVISCNPNSDYDPATCFTSAC